MKKYLGFILLTLISCGKDKKEKDLFSKWNKVERHEDFLDISQCTLNIPCYLKNFTEYGQCILIFTFGGDQHSGGFSIDGQDCGFDSVGGRYTKSTDTLKLCDIDGYNCTSFT